MIGSREIDPELISEWPGTDLCITMSYMDRPLSIRLPPALRRELNRLSRAQDRPASDVAREALRRYIAAEQLRLLRQKLRPRAEARGFLTDEDVFKAVS